MVARRSRGYLVAIIGAILGAPIVAFPVGAVVLWIGYQFDDPNQPCDEFMCFHGLAAVVGAIIAFAISFPIGAGIGCWLALRVRGHAHARESIGVLAFLHLVSVIASIVFTPVVINIDRQFGLNERLHVEAVPMALAVVVSVAAALPALARLIVLHAEDKRRADHNAVPS